MPYIATDSNGWAARSYTTSGGNAGYVAYVSAAGNDGTGVVYRIGSVTVGADPHAPAGAPATYLTVQAALNALESAMGSARAAQQGLCLVKRGDAVDMTTTGDGMTWKFSGPSVAQPFTLGAYGTSGARPQLKWWKGLGIQPRWSDFFAGESIGGIRNILLDGVQFVAHKRLPSHADYDSDNSAVTALAAATTDAGAQAARATTVSGVASLGVSAGKFTTDVENVMENITIQDCIVRGASGGFAFERATASSPLVRDFFVNRCHFDRIYNHHNPSAISGRPSAVGRTNALFWSGVSSGRVWGVTGRYIGFVPAAEDSRSSIIRHDQSQGLYCQEDASNSVDIRDVVMVEGCFAGVQLRGGSGNTVRGVVVSGFATGASAGHRQNAYDVEGQHNVVGFVKPPVLQQSAWSDIVVEAPDAVVNNQLDQGQGFQARRMHGITVDRLLVHRGHFGNAFGATPLNVFEVGKPNPATGTSETIRFRNIVVADYLRGYESGERWNLGGMSQPRETLDPSGNPYRPAPAPIAPHAVFENVKVFEPLSTRPLMASLLAQPGGSYVDCELWSANRSFVSSFNRGGAEVQRDFDATVAHLGGSGWQWRAQTFFDPSRDMGGFAVMKGVALAGDSYATRVDKLLDACQANNRHSWDAGLLGLPMAQWILAGYGLTEAANPGAAPTLRPVANRLERSSKLIEQLPRGLGVSALWSHVQKLSATLGRVFEEPRTRSLVQVVQPNAQTLADGLYVATDGRDGTARWASGTRKVSVAVMGRTKSPAPASTYMIPVLIRGGTVSGVAYPTQVIGAPSPWVPTSDTAAGLAGWLIVGKEGRAELTVVAAEGGCVVMAGEPSEVAPEFQGGVAVG